MEAVSFNNLIFYDARSALTIFIREARTDGRNPPIIPIITENTSELMTIDGESEKLKASSANEPKFIIEILKNCKEDARMSPTNPPMSDNKSDSIRNAPRIFIRRNPSALNVPISTVRLETAAYIVIMAPIIAPRLKMIVTAMPRIRMNIAIISDCSA